LDITRDITRSPSFSRGIDKTFATSHGVKEEFLWCQALQIGILHKTLWAEIILLKVRQGREGDEIRKVSDALTVAPSTLTFARC
jgi:hypothetical protein